MPKLEKACCICLITSMLITFLVLVGEAATASITMKPGEEVIQPISLAVEDRVLIQFNVIGGTNLIQFSITFPNGTVQNLGEVGTFSSSFVCDLDGECMLNFTNADQTENKLVTLNYGIDHYILGMPQMLFMVIVIMVTSLVGVAVFIGLSRKPY
jgi:hypothetical protein